MATTSISGQVRLRGIPVRAGWLEIMPIDGTVGLLRTARLDTDGTFQATRVPVGRVAIRVIGIETRRVGDPIVDRFLAFAEQAYLIRRDILADHPAEVDIDLGLEAIRFANQGR
jgi:hypothetical protein